MTHHISQDVYVYRQACERNRSSELRSDSVVDERLELGRSIVNFSENPNPGNIIKDEPF